MKKASLGWNFPANDDGQENGLNDPGIETFKDNPLSSLAREVPQNSADAGDSTTKKPVEVHFQRLDIPNSEFPGLQEFRKTLQACSAYWKSSKQTTEFFKDALAVLAKPTLSVLKVSDFNTTGLVIGANGDRNSDWFRLTKAVGASDKNAGKLGSFGIGKHAPYACSDLRTVFYSTKDNTGATALQGVSKLVSHLRAGKVTQGTGYYGLRHGNRPILDFGAMSPIFERRRTGADVYVMGFHPYTDWEPKIIKSVIESFFVAIHNGTLVVKVGKTTLNALSLPDQIKKHYVEPDPHYFADAYYAALTNDESTVYSEDDFLGYGAITLRILENKAFKKKIAMIRRSGMKIFDKGHFQTPLRFAGVFVVEGMKLDAFLRTLEPPSHNAWEPERGEDPKDSKSGLRQLHNWVNEKVRELVGTEDLTEVDAEGISQYLPDEIEDGHGSPQETEAMNEEPAAALEMRIRSTPPSSAATYEQDKADESDGDGGEGGTEGPSSEGDGDGNGGDGNGADGTNGQNGSNKATKGDGADHAHKRVPLTNIRIYCTDSATGKYRLLFEPTSGDASYLRVFVIGEVGAEPAPITKFAVNGGPEVTDFSERGMIGPLTLPKGERAALDVVLEDSLRCALGVSAYAN
jgi:hypothetical protein